MIFAFFERFVCLFEIVLQFHNFFSAEYNFVIEVFMAEIKSKILHTVNLQIREKAEIVGVVEVVSSTEREIIAKLEDSFLHIFGSELKITKLVPEDMLLECRGKILGLEYTGKLTKKSLFGKVFK